MGGYRLVEDDATFAAVVDELLRVEAYALDTEFHRERTYFPKVALVQIAWPGDLVLVDPLVVDLAPLRAVLEGPATAVLHAADQDLEVLELVCGTVPEVLFDTQVAAGFAGLSSPSLSTLYESLLGIRVPKADRLSDWLARPLSQTQLDYAASDVAHLLEAYRLLRTDLERRGRLGWALDECEELRTRVRGARDPAEAWRRIKEARQLRGRAKAVAVAVAAWRERRAAAIDVPARFVLPDLAVVSLAQRPPSSPEQLRSVRGFDARSLKAPQVESLLATIEEARNAPLPTGPDGPTRDVERELRPALGLMSAWASQLARDLEIETALLATRADLEALLRGDADARLAHGWRAELVGQPVRRLVEGDAALAFDGNGGLVLEARSHRPVE